MCTRWSQREREEGVTDFFWLSIEVCTGYIYFSDFTNNFLQQFIFLNIFLVYCMNHLLLPLLRCTSRYLATTGKLFFFEFYILLTSFFLYRPDTFFKSTNYYVSKLLISVASSLFLIASTASPIMTFIRILGSP